MLTWTSSERERERETTDLICGRGLKHSGLKSLFLLRFYPEKCVCASECVSECVCMCVRLHLKVLLCLHMWACVFVCIWVSVWWRLVRRRMNALCLTSDLLQCCSVAVQECLNVKLHPAFPLLSPLLCLEYCYWTEHSWTRQDTFESWLQIGDDVSAALARTNSEQRREKMYISSEKEQTVELLFWWRRKGHSCCQKQWQMEGEAVWREKQLDVSVLYCHPAAIFAVVVTTNDNNSLNSLHGPQNSNLLSFNSTLLLLLLLLV